jgi:site-specific recombinase XerD
MAKLLFTTDAFKPTGQPVSGVPMLLDREMRLVEPACTWLLHIALVRGRTRSRETWRTYAETLYDWWQTLEAMSWKWDQVTPLHVSAYRDKMLGAPSDHTHRPYSRSTINARVRTLAMFYAWCVRTKLLARTPFLETDLRMRHVQRENMLAHLDVTGGMMRVNELTVRHTPSLPRPLSRDELRRIVTGVSTRDRLMIEWGLMTGARRMEVVELRVRTLLDSSPSEPLPRIILRRTKGDKPRAIHPPLQLVDRTRAYVREERAAAVRRAQRSYARYEEPTTVFVSTQGRKMSPRAASAMFDRAATTAGVRASFHSLRHTYATTMLAFLQREARSSTDLNPLLTLQVLLGHSSISTTSIYLHVLATDLLEIERSIADLYQALS